MSSSESQSRAGVGISSVLMILVVLAMAALGMLAYTSTRATDAMTRRNIEVTERYYQAAAQVQERLMAIGQAVGALPGDEADPLAWYQAQAIPDVTWSQEPDGLRFTITIPCADSQAVVAKGVLPGDGGAGYRLLSHVLQTLDQPEDDTNMNLMGV